MIFRRLNVFVHEVCKHFSLFTGSPPHTRREGGGGGGRKEGGRIKIFSSSQGKRKRHRDTLIALKGMGRKMRGKGEVLITVNPLFTT